MTKMSVFAFERAGAASALRHGPPAGWEMYVLGGQLEDSDE